eukprot:1185496-Prorocentrum_minimum.AAC.1
MLFASGGAARILRVKAIDDERPLTHNCCVLRLFLLAPWQPFNSHSLEGQIPPNGELQLDSMYFTFYPLHTPTLSRQEKETLGAPYTGMLYLWVCQCKRPTDETMAKGVPYPLFKGIDMTIPDGQKVSHRLLGFRNTRQAEGGAPPFRV